MLDEHDHRILGSRMDLFHFQDEAPGMVFWHPRGFTLYRLVEEHLRRRVVEDGYHEVRSPQLLGRALWEASGHWEHFGANMFAVDDGERAFALKPVNCPGHAQIVKQSAPSYRDLPIRLCEFGVCHRKEPSGSLLGLMRVRSFVQDDGHVFCAPEHVDAEIARFCVLLRSVYADFGFDNVAVKFSSRPSQRAGSDEVWDRAEAALLAAAAAAGLACEHQPGEGAFYGPKLEFALRDVHGRAWQCGTIQLDCVLPERLDIHYVAASGARVRPVMLHRAVLGSLERFLGILLEHHRGELPLWLAPDQVAVATISERHRAYADEVVARLRHAGVRAALDARSETIARKVVDARQAGIPAFWAVGAREAERGAVAVRQRDGRQAVVGLDDAIAALR